MSVLFVFSNLYEVLTLCRQNEVTELYSLIKFLRIKPFSSWEKFNADIAKPVKSGKGANRAMKRLQVFEPCYSYYPSHFGSGGSETGHA